MRLWQKVLVGLVLGVIAGLILKEDAADLKVLGTIFINLIKMVMVPLIFFAILTGLTSLGLSGNVKRVGFKSVTAYLLTALFAVSLGLISGNIFEPGAGLNLEEMGIDMTKADTQKEPPSIGTILLDIIPTNAIGSMAEGHILQVIVFAMFCGIVMNSMRSYCTKLIDLSQEAAMLMFKMIELIVRFAPYGVFGFIASLVGTQGMDVLIGLAKLIEAVVLACLLQYIIFGIMIVVFGRLNPIPFYRKLVTTQLMAFSTSSSKATLTTAMRELNEKLGVSKNSTNFVLPLGASMNMDGTAIYLGICAVFFAQATGVTLETQDYITLMLTCTLASIGAAGIPSGSLIFMGMVLHSVGLPIEGIALIAGVDRILDMLRTTINITGDCTVTVIIDKTEGTLDEKLYYAKESEIAGLAKEDSTLKSSAKALKSK